MNSGDSWILACTGVYSARQPRSPCLTLELPPDTPLQKESISTRGPLSVNGLRIAKNRHIAKSDSTAGFITVQQLGATGYQSLCSETITRSLWNKICRWNLNTARRNHYLVPEEYEFLCIQRFGEKIRNHSVGGTILKLHLLVYHELL